MEFYSTGQRVTHTHAHTHTHTHTHTHARTPIQKHAETGVGPRDIYDTHQWPIPSKHTDTYTITHTHARIHSHTKTNTKLS